MTNLIISPIIYTNHHHAPMSIEGWHALISMFAILTFIWIVSIIVRLIQMEWNFERAVKIDPSGSVFGFFHFCMVVLWAFILLFVAGNYTSKLIF